MPPYLRDRRRLIEALPSSPKASSASHRDWARCHALRLSCLPFHQRLIRFQSISKWWYVYETFIFFILLLDGHSRRFLILKLKGRTCVLDFWLDNPEARPRLSAGSSMGFAYSSHLWCLESVYDDSLHCFHLDTHLGRWRKSQKISLGISSTLYKERWSDLDTLVSFHGGMYLNKPIFFACVLTSLDHKIPFIVPNRYLIISVSELVSSGLYLMVACMNHAVSSLNQIAFQVRLASWGHTSTYHLMDLCQPLKKNSGISKTRYQKAGAPGNLVRLSNFVRFLQPHWCRHFFRDLGMAFHVGMV